MTIDSLIPEESEIELFGNKRKVQFLIRNFAAAKQKFKKNEYDLINKALEGDMESWIMLIWAGTLVFDDFDPANPLKIKEEVDLEKLYTLDYKKAREISIKVTQSLLQSLPSGNDTKKKINPVKKALNYLITQLKG